MQKQPILFDGYDCVMISLRDVTSIHNLKKLKQDKALLSKLHLTISKDLCDPLSLIIVSVIWLIRLHNQKKNASKDTSN